jgi:tetratricopeptide (TPR) repeat protein
MLAHAHWLIGDQAGALRDGREAVGLAQRHGAPLMFVFAHHAMGVAHGLGGEPEIAVDHLEQALSVLETSATAVHVEPWLLAGLADVLAQTNNIERARQSAERAVALCQQRHARGLEPFALLSFARVLLSSQDVGAERDIRRALDAAHELAERSGNRSFQPLIHVEDAALARLLQDSPTRFRELREAHRLFIEIGATGHAERLARELSS